MQPEVFIQPRFTGARFEQATLPISVAKDLSAYEDLVIEVARHLYREAHPKRQRVLKGFTDDFELHIERIDEGSAKPALALLSAASLLISIPTEYYAARELINEVVATQIDEKLPTSFPKSCYRYFNRLGRSLNDGEFLEFTPELPNKTSLDQTKRRRLALAAGVTWESQLKIVGGVVALDTDRQEAIIRTDSYGKVSMGIGDLDLNQIKEVLGEADLYLSIQGVGTFDVSDKLQKIDEVDHLETIKHYPMFQKLTELSTLKAGWLEGTGAAILIDQLESHFQKLGQVLPSSKVLAYPAVVPTEEGSVSLEWATDHSRIELEIDLRNESIEFFATDVSRDHFEDDQFEITDWEAALTRVQQFLNK